LNIITSWKAEVVRIYFSIHIWLSNCNLIHYNDFDTNVFTWSSFKKGHEIQNLYQSYSTFIRSLKICLFGKFSSFVVKLHKVNWSKSVTVTSYWIVKFDPFISSWEADAFYIIVLYCEIKLKLCQKRQRYIKISNHFHYNNGLTLWLVFHHWWRGSTKMQSVLDW
jgi:hypothetical protein